MIWNKSSSHKTAILHLKLHTNHQNILKYTPRQQTFYVIFVQQYTTFIGFHGYIT
jgi:hypothetical protein